MLMKNVTLKYAVCSRLCGQLAPMTLFWGALVNRHYLYSFSRSRAAILYHAVAERIARRRTEKRSGDAVIRPLALYLPQFHTFPENDKWWGKGFTEWTNVKKAKPLFKGHYQPHVPHPDIGYYDLNDVEVMRKQAAMAKKYGIYGFVFYYYHFANGKRLLEKPLNNWLNAKDIDFPFCYAWANENWTRAWDGGDKEIIMPQEYGRDNMMLMMRNMLEDFKDPRYIKVGPNKNTPVLFLYRPEIIPEVTMIIAEWRRMAKERGFDDLYLITMQNFKEQDPRDFGADAASEFSAGYRGMEGLFQLAECSLSSVMSAGAPDVFSYKNMMRFHENRSRVDYPRYKCAAPSWDNTPRKGSRGLATVGATVRRFRRFFRYMCDLTMRDSMISENGFVLINAWNEWGEGAHLEPDVRNGYGYLDAVRSVLQEFEGLNG